ncbi:helix-turn-helix domain-containing protein [Flavobacterium luteolum]|uniref:helix-turn-helix domain-containing protein n=1 Tax=Flavobacterium luteolum TaxID=3003259 RepID=UPI00248D8E0D|nr:helix-turn-helix transcriptional regulator [Flavobacterium luteolum]
MNEKPQILITFGNNVRQIRISKGLSQEQLAHLADVHRTYIGMIERAEKNITLINIQKIAKGLNVNLIDLFKND